MIGPGLKTPARQGDLRVFRPAANAGTNAVDRGSKPYVFDGAHTSASACGKATDDAGSRRVSDCKARVREHGDVSDSELTRIEAEGVERNWPPLTPVLMSLDAVIAAAGQLCPR
jgi:hypothetical protein